MTVGKPVLLLRPESFHMTLIYGFTGILQQRKSQPADLGCIFITVLVLLYIQDVTDANWLPCPACNLI